VPDISDFANWFDSIHKIPVHVVWIVCVWARCVVPRDTECRDLLLSFSSVIPLLLSRKGGFRIWMWRTRDLIFLWFN
jgi:hypothetical protein